MTTTIEVRTTATEVRVSSPYRPAFTTDAKTLGGKWDATHKAWVFPARRDAEVREVVRKHYGTTGEDPVVTLEIGPMDDGGYGHDHGFRPTLAYGNIGNFREGYRLQHAGRDIAWADGRDSGARIGQGVIVVSGGFRSGGSRKNYLCSMEDNTVLRVVDVPLPAAEKLIAEAPQRCRIIDLEGIAQRAGKLDELASVTARAAELRRELNVYEG